MALATAAQPAVDLGRIAEALAPGRFRFDPLGIVSGYKAYVIYTELSARSDAELARLGLDRADLARVAMDAARDMRA